MAKFCSDCGASLVANKKFCGDCGASISSSNLTGAKINKKNINLKVVPQSILSSVNLYWIATGIGLLAFFGSPNPTNFTANTKMSASLVLFSIAFGLVITYFVTEQLKKGKNWMRIFLTVGAILIWFIVALDDTEHKLFNLFNYIDFFLKSVAIASLYTEENNSFFRKN